MALDDTYGENYQKTFGALDYEPFRLIRTFCRFIIPPMRVLIIGAANPRQVKIFNDRGDEVYAIDISEYAVKKSQELCCKLKNYYVSQGDVRNLNFQNKWFDISLCRYIMEHYDLRTNTKILEELARVTKKFIIVGVSTTDVRPFRLNADPTHQTYLSYRAWTEFFKSLRFVKVISESRTKESWILKPLEMSKELKEWI